MILTEKHPHFVECSRVWSSSTLYSTTSSTAKPSRPPPGRYSGLLPRNMQQNLCFPQVSGKFRLSFRGKYHESYVVMSSPASRIVLG